MGSQLIVTNGNYLTTLRVERARHDMTLSIQRLEKLYFHPLTHTSMTLQWMNSIRLIKLNFIFLSFTGIFLVIATRYLHAAYSLRY